VNQRIQAALPLWLDRPGGEALEIAQAAREAGLGTLWVGEMATFDAFALATAVGVRTPGLRLNVGPLPISVRNPVSVALGAGSVAALTGSPVDVALGASSPPIVRGWHGRDWGNSAARMREMIECLRPILAGERSDYDGRFVRSHGFRLRNPLPDTRIAVGAFGPAMTRVAARLADEIVLNLVSPQRVREVRCQIHAEAAAAGRTPPHLTVWVPLAPSPGQAALHQLSSQIAIYLAPPGYAEMFCELGFADLVTRARAGARRQELAAAIPDELVEKVCAIGSDEQITARLQEYLDAGADSIAVVPATAEDPAARAALACAANYQHNRSNKETAS
jgi:probable F420-dependent oxidoreductase